MSSAFSKQKKNLRRKRAITNEQADRIVTAINKNAEVKRREIAAASVEAYRLVKEKFEKEQKPFVQGEMLMLFLACMHCEFGYGKKRLTDLLHKLNEFGDIMRRDGVTPDDIHDMLKDECGFDVVAEFRVCEEESQAVAEKIKRRKLAV